MDTLNAYKRGQEARKQGKPLQKLDWDKLKEFVEQNKDIIYCVYAGIEEDWDWTGDEVYHEDFGWLDDHYAYTESVWGTPIAYIHYKDEYDGLLNIKEFKDSILEENND